MNRRLYVPFAAALAVGLGTLVAARAGAQAPDPTAAPTPNPADPGPPAAAPAEEKPIDFEPIPALEDKPKVPAPAEWQSATPVRFTQRGPRARRCKMLRARAWIKVKCDVQTTAIGLMGGASDGSFYWLPEAKEGEQAPASAEVMFPIKPGDRRVFELFSYGPAYGGSMISPGLVLQEHWVPGEAAPVIVIR